MYTAAALPAALIESPKLAPQFRQRGGSSHMADFATHLGWGAVGAGLAASATYAADIVPACDLITLTTAGVIGSLLPDVDLEKAVPSRSLFTGLGLVLGFIVLFSFKHSYSIIELWLIWLGVFCLVRYGGYHLFHRRTTHRGVFHSILAGLFFWALTAVVMAYGLGRDPVVAWLGGLFVFFGYFIHLVLDEVYSVDITGARLKRSFGTALKLIDARSAGASFMMLAALAVTLPLTPPYDRFLQIMQPAQVGQFFRERMFPQGRWFEMRAAETAGTGQPALPAGIAPAAPGDTSAAREARSLAPAAEAQPN